MAETGPDNFLGWDMDNLHAPEQPKDEYPWTPEEDETFRLGAFRRSWRHATRREHNTSFSMHDGTMCPVCGYKWHPQDITEDGSCFNCWLCDNKPEEVKRFWRSFEASDGQKHGETAPPKLVKLGDKKG